MNIVIYLEYAIAGTEKQYAEYELLFISPLIISKILLVFTGIIIAKLMIILYK
jgi:hypothetical protein